MHIVCKAIVNLINYFYLRVYVIFQTRQYLCQLARGTSFLHLFLHSYYKPFSVSTASFTFIVMSVFYTNVSWWFHSGVWVTANLHKSPKTHIILAAFNKTSLTSLHLASFFSSYPVPLPILWRLFQAYQLQQVSLSPSCFILFFSSLASFRGLFIFSFSLNFPLWFAGTEKSSIRQDLFFDAVDYLSVWSSGQNSVICLYLKIPEKFARLILQEGFRSEHKSHFLYGCISEFELQPRYYGHFRTNTLGKGMNLFILLAMG